MSIRFNKVIMHTLDSSLDMPLISKECLTLTDETEAYITSYITELFDNHSMAKAEFEDLLWLQTIKDGVTDFYKFSCDLARQFFAYIQTFPSIASGDLVITQFERDSAPYIAFIKLNYKEAYTHYIAHDEGGPVNLFIKHKTIHPDSISKIQEAAIINLETLNIDLLDIHKERYVHTLLGATAALSTKQKIKIVEKVIAEAIEENFENKVEAISFAKNNLAKSIDSTSSIIVDEVLRETFGKHEEIISSCMSTFEEYGITEAAIEIPRAERVGRKYTSHKIKTNIGIELKLPTQFLNDRNKIEFINNQDGTQNIVIKNIGAMINK